MRYLSANIFGLFTQFCPRCGQKLDSPKEPASCRFCGWHELSAEKTMSKYGPNDIPPGTHPKVAEWARKHSGQTMSKFFYVYAITFDQDTFGVFATRKEAEESMAEQIAGHGPAWDDCKISRWKISGEPESHTE